LNIYQYLLAFPWFSTLLSATAAFALGIFWYHPKVLGTRWLEARGGTVSVYRLNHASMIYTFLLWILSAAFYSFLTELLPSDNVQSYIGLACLLWVAFAMPPTVMGAMYTGYSFKAVSIDTAYQLAGYYLFALVHITLSVQHGMPVHVMPAAAH
jgi:hypothetical protein